MNKESWSFCTDESPYRLSRRTFLAGSLLVGLGMATSNALAQVTISPDAENRDVLVVIFLRGGADGLSILAPVHDDEYHKARPSLGLTASESLKLNDYFSAHPSLKSVYKYFEEGSMAFVPACGSGDRTRSHFEAMALMENGKFDANDEANGGWLGRYLLNHPGSSSPMRALALGAMMPESLSGGPGAMALESLEQFKLLGGPQYASGLEHLYRGRQDTFGQAAEKTLSLLKTLQNIDAKNYKPSGGATYDPKVELAQALKQVAILIKSGVGLEVACLDKGGWDTHVAQGAATGFLANNLKELSDAIAAFATDLGDKMRRVTLVVQTEFGRRVEENSGLGTDHGRASVMWLLGGGIRGGKVYGDWPGVAPAQRDAVGDLKVANDYRDLLSEVLRKRMGADPSLVFPGRVGKELGIVKS